VFDNNSRDDVEVLKAEFPSIRIIANDRNIGFAAGVNRVLNQTRNPYILLLNPDTIVFPGFFDSILSFMGNHTDTGILGTQILDADGCVQGSARAFPSFHTALFGRSSLLSKLFPNNRLTCANVLTGRTDGNKPIDVDWVSGACMVVRREAVDAVGPLDENFFMYWEDTDWCSRMWAKGWKVTYWPGATVMHYIGGSSSKNLVQSVILFHKSAFQLYRKHNQRRFNFLKAFVLFGLACRCAAVLAVHGGRRLFRRIKKEKMTAVDAFKRLAN
jgi:GT2 family glycosyltransferase